MEEQNNNSVQDVFSPVEPMQEKKPEPNLSEVITMPELEQKQEVEPAQENVESNKKGSKLLFVVILVVIILVGGFVVYSLLK